MLRQCMCRSQQRGIRSAAISLHSGELRKQWLLSRIIFHRAKIRTSRKMKILRLTGQWSCLKEDSGHICTSQQGHDGDELRWRASAMWAHKPSRSPMAAGELLSMRKGLAILIGKSLFVVQKKKKKKILIPMSGRKKNFLYN